MATAKRTSRPPKKVPANGAPAQNVAPLTTGQAADRLGVTATTVRRYVESDRLPATRLPGGHYRIAQTDLDVMLRQGHTRQVGL